ncbi:MAG: extracellular solute-binding protein [Lachnospiraceae bacterium]|nr:extracellular solute-binding protein [Lachnospiraceae bacterium]
MKKITRIACVLATVALAVAGLAGCGKKQAEDAYEYSASFKQNNVRIDGTYMANDAVAGGKYYGIEVDYKENGEDYSMDYKLHVMDLASGEDKICNLEKPGEVDASYNIYGIVPANEKIYAFAGTWDMETYESNYSCVIFNLEGKVEKEISLSSILGKESYLNSEALSVTDDGKILLTNNDGSIVACDENGKQLFTVKAGYHVSRIVKSSNGDIFCDYYSDGGESVARLDTNKGSLENPVSVSNSDNIYAGVKSLFVSTGTSVHETDMATGESKALWSWLDVDVDDNMILGMTENEDGTYTVISESRDDENKKLVVETATISYLPVSDNAKEKLVYGCVYLDWDIKDLIKNFNKTNDKYRISVKAYSDEYPDWSEADEKFRMDISAGNKFDIINIDSPDLQALVDAKALADLTEYFDKDFKREDYFEKVLDITSRDGKLYGLAPTFTLQTMMVSEEIAAGRTTWTLNDVMELRKKYPDKTFLEGADRNTALLMMLYFTLDEFADVKSGECYFDSDKFKTLLDFSMTFPESFNYENFDSWQAIADGDVLMSMNYISDFDLSDLQLYNQLFNGKGVLIGFPSDSGSGHKLDCSDLHVISSKSKNKEGAWEFLKTLLSDDFQHDAWNFPISKRIFDEKVEERLKEDNRFGGGSIGNGQTVIEIGQPTKAEFDLIKNAIDNANAASTYDEKVFEIIREETEPFFKGQKGAAEVADLIQKRVRLYLQEKK